MCCCLVVQKGNADKASEIINRLHRSKGEAYVLGEITQINAQIRMETEESKEVAFLDLFSRRYLRRTATSAYMMCITQLAGAGVIQSYQSLFYEGLGFKGNTVLLITGCYGLMGVLGQGINLVAVSDRWRRSLTMRKFRCPRVDL